MDSNFYWATFENPSSEPEHQKIKLVWHFSSISSAAVHAKSKARKQMVPYLYCLWYDAAGVLTDYHSRSGRSSNWTIEARTSDIPLCRQGRAFLPSNSENERRILDNASFYLRLLQLTVPVGIRRPVCPCLTEHFSGCISRSQYLQII